MGIIQGGNKKNDTIFLKIDNETGRFKETFYQPTEGAVERITKENTKVYERLHGTGVKGMVNGITMLPDAKFGGHAINVAFVEPGEPDVLVSFRQTDKSGATLAYMLSSMKHADLRNEAKLFVFTEAAGTEFTDKEGKVQVREFNSIRPLFTQVGPDGKNHAPKAEDKEVPMPTVDTFDGEGNKVGSASNPKLLKYMLDTVETISQSLKDIRAERKAALDNAKTSGEDYDFGPTA